MIYLIGVFFALICICSWLGVAIVLFIALMNGLTWLGENGDSIIIWKKSKKK